MKATSGAHYVALDHVRAVAVLLVFVWHFTHGPRGYPVPYEGSPIWGPLVLFDEGHVGVSLFMTLSGYLFAKLLEGRRVKYHLFLWNRILRLSPLFIVVMLVNAVSKAVDAGDVRAGYWFLLSLPRGFVLPSWPNGAWSIAVELHFYLLLPLLLFLQKRTSLWLGLVLTLALSFRTHLFIEYGEVQSLAYWTIVGRLDQFILGILAFNARKFFTHAHLKIAFILVIFISIYYWFDKQGGFYLFDGYPSASPIWIVLPTLEGIAFASAIAWYETSFSQRGGGVISDALSKIGEYSFSIYLLHVFVVFHAANWIHTHVLDISNFYVALPVALLVFAPMIPVGYVSMKLIEQPFLRLRRPYYVKNDTAADGVSGQCHANGQNAHTHSVSSEPVVAAYVER